MGGGTVHTYTVGSGPSSTLARLGAAGLVIWLAATAASAATLDWSTVVWTDGQLTNTYTVGGVDVRITVSTVASGTFTDFGVSSPYEDGPPPAVPSIRSNFGCCLDLGVIFNPAAAQGTSTINIDVEFLEVGTNTPATVSGVSFEVSDIDFSAFGLGEEARIDQVVITSDGGNPSLAAKTGTPSFAIVGNAATSNGSVSVPGGSDNGTVLASFGATELTTVNIDYNEVSGNNNPGGRGIGVLFDLDFEPEAPAIDIEKATEGQDADSPPGPTLTVGTAVEWTYEVTNTGNVTLSNVTVTDDQGVVVTCPKTTLAPGESMTCTAAGVVQLGQYSNVGTAAGESPGGTEVDDSDPSHYFGLDAAIQVEKATNGQDADSPPGPAIPVGDPVSWTYEVTNTGNVALQNVSVTDDQGVVVTCPGTTLDPGESMTCTGAGTAQAGQYANVATASGQTAGAVLVQDTDPSHYIGASPGIDLEKFTNGQDADSPPGPTLTVGDPVTWLYVVSNTGNVALSNVTVTDDQGVVVTCPKTTLAAGETMLCSAAGTVQAGQYANVGTATGEPPGGGTVEDEDPSHYFGQEGPRIDVEKATNGQDADTAPGPTIAVGDPVTWSYVVTNTGNVPLSGVAVADDELGAVTCPKTTLAIGESMTCTANGTAQLGQYSNLATATGQSSQGTVVQDTDPSHYIGQGDEPAIDLEKATNGQDADTPPGPTLTAGDPVAWTYVVTNVGDVALSNVTVTDDQGVVVSCPTTTLAPAESMTCTGNGTVEVGQYANVGTATGEPPGGGTVEDSDPSHYVGTGAAVGLVKTAGGAADGESLILPALPAVVTYSYQVTNTGATWLSELVIVDDRGTPDPGDDVTLTALECPGLAGPLSPGGMITCTTDIEVTVDTVNLAVVTGNPTDSEGNDLPGQPEVTANDPAVVVGPEGEVPGIPTLGEWALLTLALLLALSGLALHGRRRTAGPVHGA